MNNAFNPFSFHGRLGRGRYVGYGLLLAVIWGVVQTVVLFGIVYATDGYIVQRDLATLFGAASLVGALLGVSYTVRRLHDLNHSGWWVVPVGLVGAALGYLVPWAALVIAVPYNLYLLFAPGTNGSNRFG